MRLRNFLFALIIMLLSVQIIYAESGFIPWDADVNIADENIPLSRIKQEAKARPEKAVKHRHRKSRTVYNGPQGGAYFLIRFFQVVISPQDGPHCRFSPTCSAYGRQAVERFGSLLGPMLAGDRLIRCNPFSPPGADPVPEKLLSR